MRKIKWMDELKIGDKVIVQDGNRLRSIETVTGVSKKSVFIGEKRFSKWNSLLHVKSYIPLYYRARLIEPTEEELKAVQRSRNAAIDFIKNFDYDKLTTQDLQQVERILRRYK